MTYSPAWKLMKAQHGVVRQNEDLLLILTTPTKCLTHFCITPLDVCINTVRSLPPNFVPLLCCIVSEQFGTLPSIIPIPPSPAAGRLSAATYRQCAVTVAQIDEDHYNKSLLTFLKAVLASVCNLALVKGDSEASEHFPFLTAPATLHFLKALVVLSLDLFLKALTFARNSISCLSFSLGVWNKGMKSQPVDALSTSQKRANKDNAGLPRHLDPCYRNPVLESDILVFEALNKHIKCINTVPAKCFQAQGRVLDGWLQACISHPNPQRVLSAMAPGLTLLAQQCAHYGPKQLQPAKHDSSWLTWFINITAPFFVWTERFFYRRLLPSHQSAEQQFHRCSPYSKAWSPDTAIQRMAEGQQAVRILKRLVAQLKAMWDWAVCLSYVSLVLKGLQPVCDCIPVWHSITSRDVVGLVTFHFSWYCCSPMICGQRFHFQACTCTCLPWVETNLLYPGTMHTLHLFNAPPAKETNMYQYWIKFDWLDFFIDLDFPFPMPFSAME